MDDDTNSVTNGRRQFIKLAGVAGATIAGIGAGTAGAQTETEAAFPDEKTIELRGVPGDLRSGWVNFRYLVRCDESNVQKAGISLQYFEPGDVTWFGAIRVERTEEAVIASTNAPNWTAYRANWYVGGETYQAESGFCDEPLNIEAAFPTDENERTIELRNVPSDLDEGWVNFRYLVRCDESNVQKAGISLQYFEPGDSNQFGAIQIERTEDAVIATTNAPNWTAYRVNWSADGELNQAESGFCDDSIEAAFPNENRIELRNVPSDLQEGSATFRYLVDCDTGNQQYAGISFQWFTPGDSKQSGELEVSRTEDTVVVDTSATSWKADRATWTVGGEEYEAESEYCNGNSA